MDGIGLGKELEVISFDKNYVDYDTYMRNVKDEKRKGSGKFQDESLHEHGGYRRISIRLKLQGSLSTHNILKNDNSPPSYGWQKERIDEMTKSLQEEGQVESLHASCKHSS